jgi:hypothetical protein
MSYYRHLILSDPYLVNQVAHYPFDANANDLINGINGTSTSINYGNAGKIGNCATFSGTSSLILLPDNDNLSFGSGSFSINFWLYPTQVTGSWIFSKKNSAGVREYDIYYTGPTIVISLYGSVGSIGRTFTATVSYNAWNMITFTFPGGTAAGNIKGYLNSNLITVASNQTVAGYTGMPNTVATVKLGRDGTAANNQLQGRLDQTRIWKGRELSASEITDIYNTLY